MFTKWRVRMRFIQQWLHRYPLPPARSNFNFVPRSPISDGIRMHFSPSLYQQSIHLEITEMLVPSIYLTDHKPIKSNLGQHGECRHDHVPAAIHGSMLFLSRQVARQMNVYQFVGEPRQEVVQRVL